MKKVIILAMLIPYLASGQITCDFESGQLNGWIQSQENHWTSSETDPLTGRFSLHHSFDNPSNGMDCIGTPLLNFHPEKGYSSWSFGLRHGYDPSSANNWVIWIMSDTDPVSSASGSETNGYAVGVNFSGYDDTLRIWKVKDGNVSKVVTSSLNWQNDIGLTKAATIKITRNPAGEWNICVSDVDDIQIASGTGRDAELFNSEWFNIQYRYSSTRDRLLWFDDLIIEGTFFEDIDPPHVTGYRLTGRNSIELMFDEEPSEISSQQENFLLNTLNENPQEVSKVSPTCWQLVFSEEFCNKQQNNLIIREICDKNENCTENINIGFLTAWAETADIIITEIMPDPLPVVSLPGKEFIEIFNRTDYPFNLKNWELCTEDQKSVFPEETFLPGEYIILCTTGDTSFFSDFGKVIGLKPFPALTDEGKILYLTDSDGNFISGVEYTDEWYHDKLKSFGGWSLEIIDTGYPFHTEGNWGASVSKTGGTPGRINSLSGHSPDMIFEGLVNVFPEDSMKVNITFSETVIDLAEGPGMISIGENSITSVVPSDPLFRSFVVIPGVALKLGHSYTLYTSAEINDYAGNNPVRGSFRFGLPEKIDRNDLVFNELLFNPAGDDPDYIEFYNLSDKVLDGSLLWLTSVNDLDTSELKCVSSDQRCIMPGTVFSITTSREKVLSRYFSGIRENIFNVGSLPSMPDDMGHLILFDYKLDVIDEVRYIDDMHFSLLSGVEGVSLEKIRPDLSSGEAGSWHSASESSGWGTPGAINSVYMPGIITEDEVKLSAETISPDNNGFEDFLVIDLKLEGSGNIITVSIYDEGGALIKKIVENHFAGNGASIIWDGTSYDGSLADTGIYIILIELYDERGKIRRWKKACALIR